MTTKTRKHLNIILGVIAVIVVLLFHYKDHELYCCQTCWSQKIVSQWRLGSHWEGISVPLAPAREKFIETIFYQDFLTSNHVHNWWLAQSNPRLWFDTVRGGCGIGLSTRCSFLSLKYEDEPKFRAFILEKVRDGSLTKSNLLVLMATPFTKETSPIQKEAEALWETFSSK